MHRCGTRYIGKLQRSHHRGKTGRATVTLNMKWEHLTGFNKFNNQRNTFAFTETSWIGENLKLDTPYCKRTKCDQCICTVNKQSSMLTALETHSLLRRPNLSERRIWWSCSVCVSCIRYFLSQHSPSFTTKDSEITGLDINICLPGHNCSRNSPLLWSDSGNSLQALFCRLESLPLTTFVALPSFTSLRISSSLSLWL